MKMTKKIFLGAVAVVALALVGCAGFGEGDVEGDKWTKSLTMDSTGDIGAKYSRAFKALSSSKKCSEISTTITVNKDATLVGEASQGVVGLAFDTHLTKDDDGNEFYDFALIGVRPSTGDYYVERYVNVSKDKLKESMTTDQTSIDKDAIVTSLDGKGNPEEVFWAGKITIGKNDADDYMWDVDVTQTEPFKYVVSLNGKEVAKYDVAEDDQDPVKLGASKGKQAGQIFMYANAPKGTSFTATYTSDKETTVGLFADEE